MENDFLLRMRHFRGKQQKNRISMFRALCHTSFVQDNMIRLTQVDLDGASQTSAAYPGDFFVDLIFTDARSVAMTNKHVNLEEEERRALDVMQSGENKDDFWLNISQQLQDEPQLQSCLAVKSKQVVSYQSAFITENRKQAGIKKVEESFKDLAIQLHPSLNPIQEADEPESTSSVGSGGKKAEGELSPVSSASNSSKSGAVSDSDSSKDHFSRQSIKSSGDEENPTALGRQLTIEEQ